MGGKRLSSTETALDCAILLEPKYRDYVWGGSRLLPGKSPIAEAWIIFEEDKIVTPAVLAGKTLSEVSQEYGAALLGEHNVSRTGPRFPLLIKLLDCAHWLSLQVHPDDKSARDLEGPQHFGKTELWHFLDAAPDSEILCGLLPGMTPSDLRHNIVAGTMTDIIRRLNVHSGQSIFIPPGTIHALGPGLFVYEVQQSSNITYRAFDWNRPATPERPLHVEKTLAVTDINSRPELISHPPQENGLRHRLQSCDYFTLDLLQSQSSPIMLDTGNKSFHIITVIKGRARVQGNTWSEEIGALQSVLVPAIVGPYSVNPESEMEALLAFVE